LSYFVPIGDYADIHKHLYNLATAKEKLEKENALKHKDSVTLTSQENPLSADIETGPPSYEDRSRNMSHSRAPALWCLDDEKEYDFELELALGDGDMNTTESLSVCEVGSLSEAIQGSRISMMNSDLMQSEVIQLKEDRLQRLLNRLRTHVNNSQGSGGKPFHILIDAGE
jgi:hypothetical protein